MPIALRMNLLCRACQTSNPLNGIGNEFTCYHCSEVNLLDLKFWSWFLNPDVFARARALPPSEEGRSGRIMPVCTVIFSSGPAKCGNCAGELPTDALLESAAAGRCFCPSCGQPVPVRAADELLRALDPRAQVIVGESLGGGAVENATAPVVFGCMACGGALRVDGSSRTAECTYCTASNYLPDALWRQLHPVPKPHDIYVV